MSYSKYTIYAAMITIFVIAALTFAINFASDNNAEVSLGDDPDFSETRTNATVQAQEIYSGSSDAYDSYQSSTISSQTEASEGGTQFKITTPSLTDAVKNTMWTPWKKVFGQGSGFGVIFSIIIGTLVLLSAAYWYKAWVGRNPD